MLEHQFLLKKASELIRVFTLRTAHTLIVQMRGVGQKSKKIYKNMGTKKIGASVEIR